MTLQNKVVALREFFGLTDGPLLPAIAEMNRIMELPSEGSLLGQVDKLLSKTGVVPASTTPVVLPAQVSPVVLPAQVSPAAAQTPPPAATAASAVSRPGSKRKLDQTPSRQLTLLQALPKAPRISINASELQTQRDMAAQGQDYSPRQHDGTFKGMKSSSDVVKPVAIYQCLQCPREFRSAAGLASHNMYAQHESGTKRKIFAPLPPPPPPRIELRLAVGRDGRVSSSAWIGGVAVEEIEAERVAAAETAAAREKQQSVEANRRSRRRDAEGEVESGEHRRGSGKRDSFTAKQKLACVEVRDRIYQNPAITNKGEAWCDKAINPKFYGVAWGNLSRWSKPEERRRLAVAAAQVHACTLLRIDKDSRRVGKYAEMERQLFERFKARRARARKASPRWLTHMAR